YGVTVTGLAPTQTSPPLPASAMRAGNTSSARPPFAPASDLRGLADATTMTIKGALPPSPGAPEHTNLLGRFGVWGPPATVWCATIGIRAIDLIVRGGFARNIGGRSLIGPNSRWRIGRRGEGCYSLDRRGGWCFRSRFGR